MADFDSAAEQLDSLLTGDRSLANSLGEILGAAIQELIEAEHTISVTIWSLSNDRISGVPNETVT